MAYIHLAKERNTTRKKVMPKHGNTHARKRTNTHTNAHTYARTYTHTTTQRERKINDINMDTEM